MTTKDDMQEMFNTPVSDKLPSGVDIRNDTSPSSIYYKIKDARTAARAAERRILMEDDQEAIGKMVPEWNTVLEVAPNILTGHAKDLEVAVWYIEALTRQSGFRGLKYGLQILKSLVEHFWDDLFPLPDEDGIETRVAPLTGLNGDDVVGTLISPILQIPLTQGNTDLNYATWHFQQAAELERILDKDKKQARINNGATTMSQIQRSALETPYSFYTQLMQDINDCIAVYQALCADLEDLVGDHAPPRSNITNALNKVKETVAFLTKDLFTEESIEDEQQLNETEEDRNEAELKKTTDTISSRKDAVKALHKVSDFFRKTEPHSPISYSLEQAIQWSRMNLPELLIQLIPDKSAREEFNRLTGMPQRTD